MSGEQTLNSTPSRREVLLTKLLIIKELHRMFSSSLLTIDKQIEDFTIQKEEVEKIRWLSKESLKKELRLQPENFTSGVKEILEMVS